MAKAGKAVSNGAIDSASPSLAVAEDMLDFINTAWTQFHAVGVHIKAQYTCITLTSVLRKIYLYST